MPELSREIAEKWWSRIKYETPPWAWRSDPYLEGITEEQFNLLRDMEEFTWPD